MFRYGKNITERSVFGKTETDHDEGVQVVNALIHAGADLNKQDKYKEKSPSSLSVQIFPRYWKSMEDRRARGEEHEKCDQTAKQLAKRSVCEGASEAGCMYSRTAENPHLSLMRSNVRRIT